jgi:hypothetical protein
MANPPDYFWVTWTRTGDETAARKSAMIWHSPTAPPQLSNMFLAGPFRTQQAAQAYADAIGKNTLIPTPGTPIVGNVQAPSLPKWLLNITGLSGWFMRGMKVVFGGVLIILGISRLTGVDNKITQIVSKMPVPIPV